MSLISIGELLKQKPTQGLGRSIQASIVLAEVDKFSQGRYKATCYRHGRLTLQAQSAPEAQELDLRREQLLDDINRQLGKNSVRELIIRS